MTEGVELSGGNLDTKNSETQNIRDNEGIIRCIQ